jgi:hypothetical protein
MAHRVSTCAIFALYRFGSGAPSSVLAIGGNFFRGGHLLGPGRSFPCVASVGVRQQAPKAKATIFFNVNYTGTIRTPTA